ncbi:MAG: hypothetical protein ACKN9M_04355 [Burkholderiaceae bacterium]
MSKLFAILAGIVITIGLIAAAHFAGLISLDIGDSGKVAKYKNKGVLEVICDAEISRPGEKLTPPFETSRMPLPATFDFEDGTGAYAGEYTISLNRKGTLKAKGELLEIYRPAMFKRHGVVIIGEHVTLDRRTGEFKQWLDLDGGKRLDLIRGTCKRTDNAPF